MTKLMTPQQLAWRLLMARENPAVDEYGQRGYVVWPGNEPIPDDFEFSLSLETGHDGKVFMPGWIFITKREKP